MHLQLDHRSQFKLVLYIQLTLIGSNIRLSPQTLFGPCDEVSGQDSNLGSVLRVELSHDVAKMNFYRVLAHVQFVGDLLVRLSVADFLDDLHLLSC